MLESGPKAQTVKMPELLGGIQAVHKAIETIRLTTGEICELLRIGLNECVDKASDPIPTPPLITERCMFLDELRANLYSTNERLQLVLNALREV